MERKIFEIETNKKTYSFSAFLNAYVSPQIYCLLQGFEKSHKFTETYVLKIPKAFGFWYASIPTIILY